MVVVVFRCRRFSPGGVVVAVASLTGVGRSADGGPPGQIVVEILATLAVKTGRIVLTFALPVDHILAEDLLVVQGDTSVSVAKRLGRCDRIDDGGGRG